MGKKDHNDSKNENFLTFKIKDVVSSNFQVIFSWLSTTDGKILSKGISAISPFIIGNPWGFLFPFIMESADMIIRKRFLNSLLGISDELDLKKPDLNYDFIQSPEGQKLLKDTFRRIIQETNEEKIEYLKRFLITSYSDKKSGSELISTFFKILSNMDPIHIKLLTILDNPKEIMIQVANERKKNPRPVEKRPYGKKDCAVYWSEDLNDDLNNFYLHADLVVYANAHKDLVTWNILETKFIKFWLYDGSTFDENLDTHLREIERWTTLFGKQLLDHIYKNDIKRKKKSL